MESTSTHNALLKQIEDSASEIFENAPCGYLFSDVDGNVLKINKTFSILSGYKSEELIKIKRFRDILTIGSKIYYETNFDPLLRMQGHLNEIALDLLTKDRKILPVLVNSVSIKNERGQTLGYQTTFFNISDRRAYERELLSAKRKSEVSELRFKFLASAGKLLQGTHDKLTGFKDLTSIAIEDFCDACCIDLLAGDVVERVAEAYKGQGKVLPLLSKSFLASTLDLVRRIQDLNGQSKKENEGVLPWLKEFKDFCPESIITTPIILYGQAVGVISFVMLELGRKFEAADETLAVEISRRLSLAIEASRLEAEKNESLNSLKEERDVREKFVATLTHDLRSPITAIKMGAQLISHKTDKDEIKQLATRVMKGVDRADAMIQDLLDANSLRVGQSIPLDFAECNLNAEISETVADLSIAHGNRFRVISDSEVTLVASAQGVKRAIENLCNNAVKYGSLDSEILITLRHTPNGVDISVHNSGNPISLKDQSVIFDLYRRTDSAAVGGQKGWGLGLALVKGVIESHGGKVAVNSSEIDGTTFTVSLPQR